MAPGPILRTARDAAALFEGRFAGSLREKLIVAHLDSGRRLLDLREEPAGGEDRLDVPVRTIIADSLRLGGAGIVLAHCHPSGDPTPSAADVEATRRLSTLAVALGIGLHDHLVFGGGDCRSFRALGLL